MGCSRCLVHFAAIGVLFAYVVCEMCQRTVVYPTKTVALPPTTTRTVTHSVMCISGGNKRGTLKIFCSLDYEVANSATEDFVQEYGGSVAQRGGGGGRLRVESYINDACRSFTNRWQLNKFVRTNLSDIVRLQVTKEIEAMGHRSWVHVRRVSISIDKRDTYTVDIEVVNRLRNSRQCVSKVISQFGTDYDKPLIYDYIPSEVAQFCKNYPLEDIYIRRFDELDEVLMSKLTGVIKEFGMSECLSIQKVRIGRPKLSTAMRTRFEAIEHEEKEKDLAEQKKLTEKVKLEAQLQRAKMLSQQEQEESRIQMETKVLAAKKQAEIQEIQNAMRLKQAQATAEGHLLQKQSEADGLKATVDAFNDTSAMLEWHRNQAYWQSPNKVYYFADSADHMPKSFIGGLSDAATEKVVDPVASQ